jgi:ribonuclease HI
LNGHAGAVSDTLFPLDPEPIDHDPDPQNRTQVYTDGACQGNPGPGGWGWAIPGGAYASGAENPSTNQRMELQAVLHAVTNLVGPLEIISDSTYVVNCFKDKWWAGWERRGWKNSQKKDVANQDLWKPLVAAYKSSDVTFTWVKGHAGNEWNEVADQLAVEAAAGNGTNGEVRTNLGR